MSCTRTPFTTLHLLCVFGTSVLPGVIGCDDEDGDDTVLPGDGSDAGEADASPPSPPFPPGPVPEPEPGPGPGPGPGDASTPGPGPAPRDAGGPFDGGVADAGAAGADAGLDAGLDAGYPSDAGLLDAGFVADGGVLRPVEEDFDEDYLGRLTLPDQFEIAVYAQPGGGTRMLAVHDDALYVTRPTEGDVLRLADEDGDGVAEAQSTVAEGWPMIHGIVFNDDDVYLATPTQVVRGGVGEDGEFLSLEVLIDDLPEAGRHGNRTLGIGPDGRLYISVGSSCDACVETNPEHATLLRATLDGSERSIFARGLRNTIGFGWHPNTEELWGMDHGSDWRGDDIPPEELNRIDSGENYGWPYCYDDEVDPIIQDPPGQTKEEYCADTTPPVLTWQAHEAPIGLTFYDGTAFPPAYRGDAFVAMHGSWNRVPATGYSIVRIDFESGNPTRMVDFVDGFLAEDGLSTFGRPAGITTHPDGSLLFSDDSNGIIYRVSRKAPDAGTGSANDGGTTDAGD